MKKHVHSGGHLGGKANEAEFIATRSGMDYFITACHQQEPRYRWSTCLFEFGTEKNRIHQVWRVNCKISERRRMMSKRRFPGYLLTLLRKRRISGHWSTIWNVWIRQKLARENNKLQITKYYIISLSINRQRPKRIVKGNKWLLKFCNDQ